MYNAPQRIERARAKKKDSLRYIDPLLLLLLLAYIFPSCEKRPAGIVRYIYVFVQYSLFFRRKLYVSGFPLCGLMRNREKGRFFLLCGGMRWLTDFRCRDNYYRPVRCHSFAEIDNLTFALARFSIFIYSSRKFSIDITRLTIRIITAGRARTRSDSAQYLSGKSFSS